MNAVRQIHRLTIAARRPSGIGYATAADLELTFDPSEPSEGECALIHAADLARERALFTLHTPDGLRATVASTFLYASALDHAIAVSSVPFERLAAPRSRAASPTFLFSIGRSGSTLLVQLLRAAGCQAASEPDWFTQICRLSEAERYFIGPAMEQAMVRAGVASLASHLGPRPFIKLRSQCNARPELLMQPMPGARAVLLLRGRRHWALSRWRAFREPPEQIADMLREGVTAYDHLADMGRPPLIVWYEDVLEDPAGALLAIQPGLTLDADAHARITAVMTEDSQAGTGLAREAVGPSDDDPAFFAAFEPEWQALRGRAARSDVARTLLQELDAR